MSARPADPLRRLVGSALRRAGWERRSRDVTRHEQRARLLADRRVDLVIDGGANVGQYAADELRRDTGFAGRIVSFEPVPATYARLAARAASDPLWETRELGLSDRDATVTMQVPGDSSDLASVTALTAAGAALVTGDAGRVARVDVPLRRLDGLDVLGDANSILLKLDLQGHEPEALDGAAGVLDRVTLIECELPFVPLYAGQATLAELLARFAEHGFVPVGAYSTWVTPHGTAVDADVFLVRR